MNARLSVSIDWQTSEELDATVAALIFERRMETFCHAFLRDFVGASAVTRMVLPDSAHPGDAVCLYRRAIIALMRRGDFELPVPTCALSANVAWLLREVAGLTYAQIAEVLQMSAIEVARRICDLRETVLAMVLNAQ